MEAFSLWEAMNMERIHLFCFFLYSLKSNLACLSPTSQTIRNISINKITVKLPKRTNRHVHNSEAYLGLFCYSIVNMLYMGIPF